jgi:hypothetical protein
MIINYPEEKNINGPLIFLVGPIECAPLWQEEASKILQSLNDKITIVSPRMENDEVEKNLGEASRIKKIDWETKYLNQASQNGAILFWLAKRIKDIPSQAYAKSSRFEIAEWKEKYRNSKFNLSIGIETGFDGDWYIRHRLNQDCPDLKISSTLIDTCKLTIELISKSS